MASLDTIRALRGMAADSSKRKLLVKDATCIGGLVMVLSNPDVNIVRISLETLLLLSERSDHRKHLKNFMGMMEQLENLLRRYCADGKVKELAERLYTVLYQSDLCTPLKDTANTSTSNKSSKKNTSKNKSLLGSSHTKNIVLQLRGMIDRYDRDLVTRLLLQVKGVISITFDLNRKRCIVRGKPDVKPEMLVLAVSRSQTMTAQQVAKDDNGEEVLVSFGVNPEDMDKENTTLPDYLPDEVDSPVHDSKTLARTDGKERGGKSSGWLSSAANFLTNSFYW